MSSFKEWYQHTLLDKGQAYRTTSGDLYATTGPVFQSHDTFASPHQQWVYDSSVSGATVPSGVYSNGGYEARGSDGLKIDYKHGRALFDESSQDGNAITANYSYKELNIYTTSKPEDKLIYETQFDQPPIYSTPTSGLRPDSVVAPCVFLKQFDSFNEPYSFGGEDQTVSTIRTIVFANSAYQSMAVNSLFRDTNSKVFPLLSSTPINEYGDLKAEWNYKNILNSATQSSLVHIDDVVSSRIENDLLSERHPNLYVSVVEFKLKKPRYPRL